MAAVCCRFWYMPIQPTPAGPSNNAATFIRSTPNVTLSTDDTPMMDEERRMVR